MQMNSIVSPNVILHLPDGPASQENEDGRVPTLFFFTTGNPGLIGYYEQFLKLLATPETIQHNNVPGEPSTEDIKPPIDKSSNQCVIAGLSLGGFDTETSRPADLNTLSATDRELAEDLLHPPDQPRKNLYGLEDQINLTYARIHHLSQRLRRHYAPRSASNGTPQPVRVILAGHSVGAYISLEAVRLHYERCSAAGPTTRANFVITSVLLLTPTIVDLAYSASGRVAGPLLSFLPFLPGLMQFVSGGLGSLVPRAYLEWAVRRVTGMKAGGVGLEVTVSFLVSKNGVRQALHMARDELTQMKENKWGDEVWGCTAGVCDPETEGKGEQGDGMSAWCAPRLFFLFAEKDHWVADLTRDTIVNDLKIRAETGPERYDAPVVMIDREGGLAHAWCLEQSEFVANVARQWVAQSLRAERGYRT